MLEFGQMSSLFLHADSSVVLDWLDHELNTLHERHCIFNLATQECIPEFTRQSEYWKRDQEHDAQMLAL